MTALLSERDVEAEYGIPRRTLQQWRHRWPHHHEGPPWMKLTDAKRSPVRYRRSAVEAWLASREKASA